MHILLHRKSITDITPTSGLSLILNRMNFRTRQDSNSWRLHVPGIISVVYDPQYGFPSHISVDFNRQIADDEYSVTIANFAKL